MTTLIALIITLGVLIAVHEYGHYRVALACGVKVLRFSIGMGPPIWRWQPRSGGTEFTVGAFPLGGYVRMLDEREAPVSAAERHLAFNTQSLRSRTAIVAAGPVCNLVLAVMLYALVSWLGVQEAAPVLAKPLTGSVAESAGLRGGELVERGGFDEDALDAVQSFEDVRWLVTRGALDARDVTLEVVTAGGGTHRLVKLRLGELDAGELSPDLFRRIGISGPWTQPVVGEVQAGGAAERSGLRRGDVVLRIGSVSIQDGQHLRDVIRASLLDGKPWTQRWSVERSGATMDVNVTPDVVQDGASLVGRIAAYVGSKPGQVTVQRGPLEGLWWGLQRTWDTGAMTLRMLGKMLVGQASLKNLSGPLTIADYAAKSASQGVTSYLMFLALISVSLGVLNLLPLPVLDGGYLLYYLWEGVSGTRVSDAWMDRLQRGGIVLLVMMMSIALFNDVTRRLG